MKTTKYTFIALLAAASVAAFSPMAMGQTAEKPAKSEAAAPGARQGQRPTIEKRVENLTKELTLTKEQQTKITELYKKQDEERAEMRKDGKTREEMSAAMKKFNEDFMKLLTEDQKTKYKEIQKTRGANRGGNRPNRQAPAEKPANK